MSGPVDFQYLQAPLAASDLAEFVQLPPK